MAGYLLSGKFADGDQRLGSSKQKRGQVSVHGSECPGIAFRVPDVGDVVVRRNLVAVEQWGGVAQRDQGGRAVACQPQWKIQLLPQVPVVSAYTSDLQLFCTFVQAYVIRRDEDQVVAQVFELQANLFREPLYASHILSQEASIDHDHLEFLLFNESRWSAPAPYQAKPLRRG